ncbi:MAG TPA: alpha/beta fold hydrolase [Thermodesulfobacteriota bacterium]|nr:alpha/beta fold hydrolase [Thermodesulfobacteriota bacterium]
MNDGEPLHLRIPARDRFALAASLYQPQAGTRPDAVVLINPATAVKRGFYDRFARFLADRGFAVVTYDYRGVGESRPTRLRGFAASMHEWGERDLAGVIDWIAARFPESRLLVVGHSAGGQLVGLADNNDRIRALLAVAAQSGDWRLWPRPLRYALALLWYAAVPAATRLFGYLPGWLGIGEALPRGVALEWARWCRTEGYLVGGDGAGRRAGFARVTAPVLAYSFADDPYAPAAAVDALLRWYVNAPRTHRHVTPAEAGVPAIGHFGFFRDRVRDTLWREAAAWLRARSEGDAA